MGPFPCFDSRGNASGYHVQGGGCANGKQAPVDHTAIVLEEEVAHLQNVLNNEAAVELEAR